MMAHPVFKLYLHLFILPKSPLMPSAQARLPDNGPEQRGPGLVVKGDDDAGGGQPRRRRFQVLAPLLAAAADEPLERQNIG